MKFCMQTGSWYNVWTQVPKGRWPPHPPKMEDYNKSRRVLTASELITLERKQISARLLHLSNRQRTSCKKDIREWRLRLVLLTFAKLEFFRPLHVLIIQKPIGPTSKRVLVLFTDLLNVSTIKSGHFQREPIELGSMTKRYERLLRSNLKLPQSSIYLHFINDLLTCYSVSSTRTSFYSELTVGHILWPTWPIIQLTHMTRDPWPSPSPWHESITTTHESWWVHDYCLPFSAMMCNLEFWIWLMQLIFYSIYNTLSRAGLTIWWALRTPQRRAP